MSKRRLSGRQIERIQAIQERRRQRLAERVDTILATLDEEGTATEAPPREGRVVVRHGASLAVEDDDGVIWHCLSRQNIGHPVCGDRVVWQPTADDRGVVTAILPRQTLLSRPDHAGRDKPLAANLTLLIILIAPRPEPSDYLLDQYLIAAESIGVAALIVANKMDLLDARERDAFQARFAHYPAVGYPMLWTSVGDRDSLDGLIAAKTVWTMLTGFGSK